MSRSARRGACAVLPRRAHNCHFLTSQGPQHQNKQRLKDFLRQAAANGWSCECCGIDAFYNLEAKQKHFDTKSHQEKVREVAQQEAEGFEVESESSSLSDEQDQDGGDA